MSTQNSITAAEVLVLLRRNGMTLSTAESCTGGNIAHMITLVPGSSDVFAGGVVSYSNEMKHNVLGVSNSTLEEHGAVSRQTVEQMLEGACRVAQTDCAVATSGIAGPGGGTPQKPVGTVWIGARTPREIRTELCHFSGSRSEVIEQATQHALDMLGSLLQ